ncbi:MAG: toxic anion resistance protein [Brevundimonas sp.]|uniref:toxic anion resistance protein n=1 Tax=Brevundimonas sp. TaxID=1871086 RepID=UPI00391A7E49
MTTEATRAAQPDSAGANPGGVDQARAAAIRNATDFTDAAAVASFGEALITRAGELLDQLKTATSPALIAPCREELEACRSALEPLDARRLTPRTGLGGLFDSRGKRLKALRQSFEAGASRLSASLGSLDETVARLHGHAGELDTLHAALRDLVTEFDTHLAAGRTALAQMPLAQPADTDASEAVSDTGSEAAPDLRAALSARLDQLARLRRCVLSHLALTRVIQNADVHSAQGLASVRPAVERFSGLWREGLGLDRRRPRRVRPEPAPLSDAREALIAALGAIERRLGSARERLEDAARRSDAARS